MSVLTGAKYIYTNRKNNVYIPTDIVEIDIDASNMFINTKDTYLQMGVQMVSNQYKLCPSGSAGANAFIRNFEVSSGTGKVLESIYHYGTLYGVRDFYESTISLDNKKYLHEGKPNKTVIDSESCNQYVDPCLYNSVNGIYRVVPNMYKNVEVCLPLYLSGVFSPDRDDVFPALATKGLHIRLELEDAQTALQLIKAPLYTLQDGENFRDPEYGGYSDSTGYAVYEDCAAGEETITLKCVKDTLLSNAVKRRVLTDNVEYPAHLFMSGQKIYIGDRKYTINRVMRDETDNGVYRISLDLTSALVIDVEEDTSVYVSLDEEDNDASYRLSSVRMNIGSVQASLEYQNKCVQLIKAGQFKFDIFSFTDYSMNIAQSSAQNTLKINCRNTRALSLLCVASNSMFNSVAEDSLTPDKNTPSSYNFSLYNNIIVPSKLVPLDKFNNTAYPNLYNAVALREMEKAINACVGWNCNNLVNSQRCFFIGRELSKPGYSYNCMNELALNVNYTQNTALLMHNFLCHLRLLDCRDDDVYISY